MDNQKPEISIAITDQGGSVVITGKGSLIYQTTQTAKEQLAAMPANGTKYLFDMRQIDRIDSTGFGLILNLIKRIPREVRLKVVLTEPFIRELFMVTKVNMLVDLVSGMDEE